MLEVLGTRLQNKILQRMSSKEKDRDDRPSKTSMFSDPFTLSICLATNTVL